MSGRGALPPPRFALLVSQLTAQAMIELGRIPNPVTGRSEVALDRARFTIGLLEILADKTTGNLDAGEEQQLAAALAELRRGLAVAESRA